MSEWAGNDTVNEVCGWELELGLEPCAGMARLGTLVLRVVSRSCSLGTGGTSSRADTTQ